MAITRWSPSRRKTTRLRYGRECVWLNTSWRVVILRISIPGSRTSRVKPSVAKPPSLLRWPCANPALPPTSSLRILAGAKVCFWKRYGRQQNWESTASFIIMRKGPMWVLMRSSPPRKSGRRPGYGLRICTICCISIRQMPQCRPRIGRPAPFLTGSAQRSAWSMMALIPVSWPLMRRSAWHSTAPLYYPDRMRSSPSSTAIWSLIAAIMFSCEHCQRYYDNGLMPGYWLSVAMTSAMAHGRRAGVNGRMFSSMKSRIRSQPTTCSGCIS